METKECDLNMALPNPGLQRPKPATFTLEPVSIEGLRAYW